MSNLKDIKNRINNVALTKKVTLSMKNIAAAKLAQSRKFYYSSIDYLDYNKKILIYLLLNLKKAGYGCENQNTLIERAFCGNDSLPRLLFVVGADKGLCGSFNINIIKTAEKAINELKYNNIDFYILTLGSKIKNYFNNKYKNKVYSFPYNLDISNFGREESLLVVNYIFNLITQQKVGSVDFIYTKFVSVLETSNIITQVFPIDFSNITLSQTKDINFDDLNIVTDQFIDTVIDNIMKDVILSWVYETIINSLTSEYSTRVNAMDNASNNSDDLLKILSLAYNRTRQALITKELIEIISGNEALRSV